MHVMRRARPDFEESRHSLSFHSIYILEPILHSESKLHIMDEDEEMMRCVRKRVSDESFH